MTIRNGQANRKLDYSRTTAIGASTRRDPRCVLMFGWIVLDMDQFLWLPEASDYCGVRSP